jgi:2-haloalkanoic acid dehalogenase type II
VKPRLFSFDIFGTVLDWRRGLRADLAGLGRSLSDAEFDAIVDAQGRDEQAAFRPYVEITARSLETELGLGVAAAKQIGSGLGRWPAYADSAEGLRQLLQIAPCVALTNSDREHRAGVEATLGGPLSHWFCSEDIGVYKPSPEFWRAVSVRLGVPCDAAWWHVSAYADYDLDAARALGLTSVYVPRAHCRPGPAQIVAADLVALARIASRAAGEDDCAAKPRIV